MGKRKNIVDEYNRLFKNTHLTRLKIRPGTEWNYSYYPLLFENEDILLKTEKMMHEREITPRRYFYPSLNTLPYVKYLESTVSQSISSRMMCIPLFHKLDNDTIKSISKILNLSLCS
jgi:dTDP-4-amino-4,6-dideoxygalactose transaminase